MIQTQVGGLAIQILDARGGLISKHAKEGVKEMPREISLNDADIKVAHAMGIDPKAVAMLKYKFGKGGLASGVALLSLDGFLDTGLGTGSIPPTNPGRITDKGGVPVRTVVAPEDSDAEDLPGVGRPVRTIGVTFPSDRK